jgi:hypothetical protein
MVKVAIVGSELKYWTEKSETLAIMNIHNILVRHATSHDFRDGDIWMPYEVTMVSGGCPKGGVDIWAEIIADELGIKKEIYRPEVNQWNDYMETYPCAPPNVRWLSGYKSRNLQITKACDVLYCIDPKGRTRSGGRWTLEQAKKLGKETHLIEVE